MLFKFYLHKNDKHWITAEEKIIQNCKIFAIFFQQVQANNMILSYIFLTLKIKLYVFKYYY